VHLLGRFDPFSAQAIQRLDETNLSASTWIAAKYGLMVGFFGQLRADEI
jgi:hypothetical protein